MLVPWLIAFVTTQVVEVPIYMRALLERGGRVTGEAPVFARWPAALAVAFAASAITHPIVWFVWPRVISGDYVLMVAVAEAFAILAEAAWLRAFGLRRALLWAGFANAASVVFGMILDRVGCGLG